MHLFLIRHGQSFVNLPEFDLKSDPDAPLTELGEQQAAALAQWLPTQITTIDALYCSTMQRARQTAGYVAKAYADLPITYDDNLREIGGNRADHTPLPFRDLADDFEYHAYWPSERPFSPTLKNHGSETMMHFRTRVGIFIESLMEKHPNQTVVAVCHGGVMEGIVDHVFNIGPWRRTEVWTYNTGVTHLQYVAHPGRELWRLRAHSSIEHLGPELRKS